MREILFRGKRKDTGEWVYGWYVHTKRHHCIITGCIDDGCVVYGHYANNVAMYVVDTETVGQYTGLTDKNGTKIFEGDIVTAGGDNMKVYYDENIAAFLLGYSVGGEERMNTLYGHKYVEVIGNIHEQGVQ